MRTVALGSLTALTLLAVAALLAPFPRADAPAPAAPVAHTTAASTSPLPTRPAAARAAPPPPATIETAPATSRPRAHALRPPSPAAIAALRSATDAGDASALRDLVTQDRTLLRYEALRRHLELAGPSSLLDHVDLLRDDADEHLHALLGDAFAAGASAAVVRRLAATLPALSHPSARLAAAQGVLVAGIRTGLSRAERTAATEAVTRLAADPTWGEPAADLLLDAQRPRALRRLATDRGLADATRLAAAENLLRLDARQGRRALEALALDARSERVRRYAALLTQR